MAETARYINWDRAAAIVDKFESDLSTNLKDAIILQVEDLMIDAKFGIKFDTEYTISTSDPEKHSPLDKQTTLVLKNFPVTSVTRLRDNVLATNSVNILTLIEHTNFEVRKSSGIIELIEDVSDSNLMKKIEWFTPGVNTVDVAYKYGFSSVPNDIQAFANFLAAKVIKQWDQYDSGQDVEEYTMGDYKEKVGSYLREIDSRFDREIKSMSYALNNKYLNMVR